MLGVTDLWTYVLGTIAIVLLPGPNSLFVLSTAARHGRAGRLPGRRRRLPRRLGADDAAAASASRRCCGRTRRSSWS